MSHRKTIGRAFGLGAAVALLTLLISACSTDPAPITGSTDNAANAPEFRYPELSEQLLADGPAPGYRFLQIPDAYSALDDGCDSASVSRLVPAGQNRVLRVNSWVNVAIPRGAMPATDVITAIMPATCYAVVDCYPHPYQFTGMVEIVWNTAAMGLPAGFDYSTLVPWYITDAGEFVPVQFEWRNGFQQLIVRTDHFSRYIIGAPVQ